MTMQPATIDPTLDLYTRYPLRLGGPRCGIRSSPDTSTHGQHWESNPIPSDFWVQCPIHWATCSQGTDYSYSSLKKTSKHNVSMFHYVRHWRQISVVVLVMCLPKLNLCTSPGAEFTDKLLPTGQSACEHRGWIMLTIRVWFKLFHNPDCLTSFGTRTVRA